MHLPSSRCLKNVFAAELCCPNPTEEAYSAPQNLLAGFEGATSWWRRKKEKRCERNEETERKEKGTKSKRDETDGAGVIRGWKRESHTHSVVWCGAISHTLVCILICEDFHRISDLFSLSYTNFWLITFFTCSVPAQWLCHFVLDTIIIVITLDIIITFFYKTNMHVTPGIHCMCFCNHPIKILTTGRLFLC